MDESLKHAWGQKPDTKSTNNMMRVSQQNFSAKIVSILRFL